MNPTAIMNEISRLNTSVSHLIEELEQINLQLELNINTADHNWHDEVKERFFNGPVTTVREAHKSQTAAMDSIHSTFTNGEHTIFSMI